MMHVEIPKLKFTGPTPNILYCGCHGRAGHSFFIPGMRSHDQWSDPNHSQYRQLDGGFQPQNTQEEGKVWYHSECGYMVLSFWDRSIDSRPGSHSTFLITNQPYLCFNDALELCKKSFPEVFARFKFPITLERNCFMPK